MSLKVVGNPFRPTGGNFGDQEEALTSLGIVIETVVPDSDEAFIQAIQDADVIMEREPTQPDNPLHRMDNVVLTPHTVHLN